MKKRLVVVLLTGLGFLLLPACEPSNLEPNIETTVTGQAFDPHRQQPIAGVQVFVMEYEAGTNILDRPAFRAIIDSTITDSSGRYTMHFKTTGRGIKYVHSYRLGEKYYSIQDVAELKVGQQNKVDIWAYQMHVLAARIIVKDNPNPPLRVYTAWLGMASGVVNGINNDTIIYLDVLPNGNNLMYFNITNPDTSALYNVSEETIELIGFPDTFQRTFTVLPKTFSLRR